MIETTPQFDAWLARLDNAVSARIAARLLKLSMGLWGDHKALGGGLIELREHFGPGIRLYLIRRGPQLIVVLAGGCKRRQQADIERARALIAQLGE